ncbi:hypothetical protein [Streptomyces sp. CCM_MD2014]|uniref:hypothetical protein n=1 Tax=Streptomyces sp. CCM_MD2014 TaxID=1561022 RepID=UPI00052AFF65|nr:hypothetical protein [Streptomyces sp. CCM_MD2014]AIV35632.1 hypothetical protein NI25_20790 [Streptomyces sp. CCM_MD2014]
MTKSSGERTTTTDADTEDLEAIIRSAAPTLLDEAFRAMLAERERARTAPPEPEPVLPRPDPGPGIFGYGGEVRWHCRHWCGWYHAERPDLDVIGPVVIPADGGPDDVSAAITRQAKGRHQARHDRVLAAVTEHYEQEHQEAESASHSGR